MIAFKIDAIYETLQPQLVDLMQFSCARAGLYVHLCTCVCGYI